MKCSGAYNNGTDAQPKRELLLEMHNLVKSLVTLEVFSPALDAYDKIVYLDADITVIGELKPIFELQFPFAASFPYDIQYAPGRCPLANETLTAKLLHASVDQ